MPALPHASNHIGLHEPVLSPPWIGMKTSSRKSVDGLLGNGGITLNRDSEIRIIHEGAVAAHMHEQPAP